MPSPRALLTAVALGATLAGCTREAAPGGGAVVARVGEAVLTDADLAAALGRVPAGLDSAAARRHAVDGWVATELLVQHARRAGWDREPDAERRVAASARAALEAIALERLLDASDAAPSAAAVARYYEAHRADLALREPYVRVRHLRVPAARADATAAALAEAIGGADPDAAFAALAARAGADASGAAAFATSYVPEGRLATLHPALGARVAALSPGPAVVAVPDGEAVHVVQLVDRVSAGTVPPLPVVEAELTQRLAIDARRDAEARALERLRAEAQARGDLAPR